MRTWAKRGLQTALVTGGLLMLGTGIASADEDVNPDKPASPLDGSVSAPVHFHNNAADTLLGSRSVPSVHKDVTARASDLTRAVPAGQVAPVASTTVDKASRGEPQINLPISGGIAPTEVPSFMRGAHAITSGDPVQGVFSGVLTGVPGRDEVPDVSDASDLVPLGALAESPVTLPAPAARTQADGPVQGLLGGHLGGDLLGGGLLGGGQRELPQLPAAPDFTQMLPSLQTIQPAGFGGFGRGEVAEPLADAPIAGDLTDVTAILPVIPAPQVIPASPVSADVPLVQAPGVGEVSPRTEVSTLDSTRTALANLFTTHPIG